MPYHRLDPAMADLPDPYPGVTGVSRDQKSGAAAAFVIVWRQQTRTGQAKGVTKAAAMMHSQGLLSQTKAPDPGRRIANAGGADGSHRVLGRAKTTGNCRKSRGKVMLHDVEQKPAPSTCSKVLEIASDFAQFVHVAIGERT